MPLGEYTVRAEIDIERSIEDVWAFVEDPKNDPQWCPLVPDVTLVDSDAHAHPRYSFAQRFGPITTTGTGEVISRSPPTSLEGKARVMGGEFRYTYRLEPTPGGTRFIHLNQVRWSGPMRLMHPIQRRMTRQIMERQLRTLEGILNKESE